MKSFTVAEISELLDGELIGSYSKPIIGAEQINRAKDQQITFISSNKYARQWDSCGASAAIVSNAVKILPGEGRAFIKVVNADLAMAKLLEAFQPAPPELLEEIHPRAEVHETAVLGKGCKIGAGSYVGKNVVLGDGVILYPNVTVFDETTIGHHTVIWSGTVIRERSVIGNNCIFHTNVSIGADGFGYRPSDDGRGLVKIPQIGNVVIGIVGDGCKIDNLVQIAHNCVLGRSCIMAGHSGLAGSVTLGDGVIIGGSASIKDHTTINSGAVVGAGSGVMSDVLPGKTVLGYPATDSREMLKQWVALRNLAKN